jgi:hypothetical protein
LRVARRALLVAADRYEDPGYRELRAPAGDVEMLRVALADPACGAFEVGEPLLNRDTQALRVELEDFFAGAAFEDLLVLYISGHGELRAGRLYFATATTSRARLRATALADSYVHELMEHSPARSVVLVLDCCHSGAFGKGIPKAPPEVELAERFGGSGRVTLAASAQIEYAFEGEAAAATDQRLPGSVFTAALAEGLRRADANEDGVVTLDELYRFVCDEVRRRNPQQGPRLLGDRAGEIVMALVPEGARGRLPRELLQHIESPTWYLRLGAAEELARLRSGRDGVLARAAEAALGTLAEDPDRRVADKAKAGLAPDLVPRKTPVAARSATPAATSFERGHQLIVAALERSRGKGRRKQGYRTVRDLAGETGLTVLEVQRVVDSHPSIFRSRIPDIDGNPIYKLRE